MTSKIATATMLRSSVLGPVFLPGEDGYAEEASPYNLALTHSPGIIVGATNAADVQEAVRCANAAGAPVAVLNTGHGPSTACQDDAILITTRRMRHVAVDPSSRTARAEAGVLWGEVVERASEFGLAALAGSSPTVGVAGYTLSGGASPVMGRTYGWAADHVQKIEVVTPDGLLRHATPTSEANLFWALRGGKGNFGVVTALEFSLFPVSELYAGALFFAGDHTEAVLRAYQAFTATAPEEMNSSLALLRMPDLPFVPEFMRGKLTVSVRVSYLGTEARGQELVRPLRDSAPPIVDTVGVLPYARIASIHSDPTDPGVAIEHFAMLSEFTPAVIDTMLEVVGPEASTGITMVDLRQLGGALARRPKVVNAIGHRDAAYGVFAMTVVPPELVETSRESGRELTKRLEIVGKNSDRNPSFFSPADADGDGVRRAYESHTYRRLREIKAQVDPKNLFRFSHNIPPL
ncbi:FAD-binding oxidoreductase [Actinopolymorpha pittospori]